MQRAFLLFAACLLACLPLSVLGCSYTEDGLVYSFAKLFQSNTFYRIPDPQQPEYFYEMNICGRVSAIRDDKCYGQAGSICLRDNNDPATVIIVSRYQGGYMWSRENGLITAFTENGNECVDGSRRTAKIQFICDETDTAGGANVSTSFSDCNSVFTFKTKFACASSATPVPNSSNKLSGGWVFIIILLVGFTLYASIGCAINYNRAKDYQSSGQSWGICSYFPNTVFWRSLPSLVADGCRYTHSFIAGGCQTQRGAGASQTYENL